MGIGKRLGVGAAAVAMVLTQLGCATFLSLPGGEPLKAAELGSWAGIPSEPLPAAEQLKTRVAGLRRVVSDFQSGQVVFPDGGSPRMRGSVVKTEGDSWLRALWPGTARVEGLCSNPRKTETRELYGVRRKWGLGLVILDLLARSTNADWWDSASRERVAAQSSTMVLWQLGWVSLRRVWPVNEQGEANILPALDPKTKLADVPYQIHVSHTLLAGALGAGRVNHRYYAQVLWLPIPLWRATP